MFTTVKRPFRSFHIATLAALLIGSSATIRIASPRLAAQGCGVNPIACENLNPGAPASEWDVTGAGDPNIQGFATDISVNRGETVHFKIKTDAASYQIAIYRMGYYAGSGARLIATIGPSASLPQSQPACLTDSTSGLVDCGNWKESAFWDVPAAATSGIYFAKLKRPDTGGASHILFVVRDDNGRADLLFQTSDTTWQAYNRYGGNSLYVGGPGTNPNRAYKVSYNRPLAVRGTTPENAVFNAEYPMVRWLEANGYNVSYISGADTDRTGDKILSPQNHKVFMSVGHDEYWSGGQRANVEAARAAGLHLAFFSGNEVFWKTRWEPSIDGSGTPYRTLVTYKETTANGVIDPAGPAVWTGTWRDPRFSPPGDGGKPENALTGTIFAIQCCQTQFPSIAVPAAASALRFWRNTAIAASGGGALLPLVSGPSVGAGGMLGYEWDEDLDNGFRPAGLMQLSSTTANVDEKLIDYGSTYRPGTGTHSLTLYRHSSGALVFGAGTVQWSWGLDNTHDRFPESVSNYTNISAKQATVNLFADMNAQPATLQAGLTIATPSTDTVPPSSSITAPAASAKVTASSMVTISGVASDAGGQVASVDVSVDNGVTWRRATGQTNWTYSWLVTAAAGSVTLKSRATDDSGNIETASSPVTVTVVDPNCPCSIWNPATAVPAIPDVADPSGVELGVKFRSDLTGYVTGLRFYKSAANTGTHVGNLWASNGVRMATATFAGESSSGWQTVSFPSPVAVTAGATYVASYHTDTGHYSATGAYFNTAGVDTPPLHALANSAGVNGVYVYGPSAFPASSFNGTNYWVDVIFNTTLPADTTPPTVTSKGPAAGATGVNPATVVVANFSELLDAATVNSNTFELRDASNALVAATVTYDAGNGFAALSPTAPLGGSATYTARLRGGATDPRIKDLAGNALAADVVWSFTTAAPSLCPCSLWASPVIPVADPDGSPVELGVKFKSDLAGYITGVRFYKSSTNTGTHIGNLWTTGGTKLATAVFTNETASGWQTVTFGNPVAITANTVYVASYHTDTGHYSATSGYFGSGLDTPPLHAVSNGTSPNGVYLYGASGFPTSSFNATNYWVDVVFNTTAVDATPPTVTSQSPTPFSTGVLPSTQVIVGFSEAMNPATINTDTIWLENPAPLFTKVDATVTYDAATRTATLTPTAALSSGGVYTAFVMGGLSDPRVKDLAGNPLANILSWTFQTGSGPSCPCTIWPSSTVPSVVDSGDGSAVELGVRFTADVNGTITGLRFYKSAANTGTHTGSLWTSTGTLLATATFTGETGSGWQQVNLGTPVAITANTTYVASYHTNTGRYSVNASYFAGTGANAPPLHAPASSGSNLNGVYQYGSSAFPASSYSASNYWVDVVFTTAVAADTTPPTVTTRTPAAGATGVSPATTVTATFSEALDPSTITASTFELRDGANALVTSTVTYNASTNTATLTPGSALTGSATYTAKLRGGTTDPRVKDVAGNALAADVTWSFTIQAASLTFVDTTAANFNAGSMDVTAYVGQTGDGEVMLAPTLGAEFSGTALPAGWSLASWGGTANATVAGGLVSVDGGRISPSGVYSQNTTYGVPREMEFSATFSGAAYQHVGFGLTLNETPWAIFSSRGGDTIYARTNNGSQLLETPIPGSWFGAAHRYRITWNTSSVIYWIDGVQVASHSLVISTSLRPIISDYGSDGDPIRVDWLRLSPYAAFGEGPGMGTFTSRVIDATTSVTWTTASWSGQTPAGSSVVMAVRYGNTPTPDGSWTLFTNVVGTTISGQSRYVQYRLSLSTPDLNQTPVVSDVAVSRAP